MIQSEKIKRFGHEIRQTDYNFNKSLTFCNHGSYGAVPISVFKRKQELQLEIESCPDKWFRYTSRTEWTLNKQCLADHLKVKTENILICDNATESINAALKSIEFNGSQDAILTTQYTYKAIANTVEYVACYRLEEGNHVQIFKVPCVFPIENKEQILTEFDKMCKEIITEKKLRLRCVLLDHISSSTAILYPVKEIIQIIRKWSPDTLVMVDGAHSIGQIDIDFASLDCDYYISNLHKWFLAPRGCSFLYLKDVERLGGKNLQPNYISHGYDKDLDYNFYRRGTADKSSFFCVRECVKFYEEQLGGLATIQAYTSDILTQAVDLVLKAWNTSALGLSSDLQAPYMRLIKLPFMKNYQVTCDEDAIKIIDRVQLALIEKHDIISMVVYVQKAIYIRLSCFVYNEMKDYEKLKDAILELQKE